MPMVDPETMSNADADALIAAWHKHRPSEDVPDFSLASRTLNGAMYRGVDGELVGAYVIVSMASVDGKYWLHFSMSYRSRMPTWDELVSAKRLFLGEESHAISVVPPTSQHVNVHPYCLHLWSAVEHHPLPDFRLDKQI